MRDQGRVRRRIASIFTGYFLLKLLHWPSSLIANRPGMILGHRTGAVKHGGHLWVGVLLVLTAGVAPARDKADNWLEVRSPHFTVATNSSEKQGRQVAGQFERMRSVFHARFPQIEVDPAVPIVVLAVQDEKDFRALEPAVYLSRGSLKLAGLFLRAPDKNYVLMRLDAGGEHPYQVLYHEYTHLILSKTEEWLPLWLNEGTAEFYETTQIRDKDVTIGEPSKENVYLLRRNRLLPLSTLLSVDRNSPYYHEEDKGTIFYAESWALTHYLILQDSRQHTRRLSDYMNLLHQKVDSVTAAVRAFGDLKRLQAELEAYVAQPAFNYGADPIATEADEGAYKARPLTATQSDAVRADFLAYDERVKDARTLLEQVLHDDPNNGLAHETMGYLEFRQGRMEQAREWYAQAVKLDSQSYLTHYYFAAMSINRGPMGPDTEAQVEASLRAAIKLNPGFAPPYDRLAVFYGARRENLDEAHRLNLQAVQLDPGNIGYRVNTASVLLIMQRENDAIAVLQNALQVAKKPEEVAAVQTQMENLQQVVSARRQMEEENRRLKERMESALSDKPDCSAGASDQAVASPTPPHQELPRGPHRSERGTLKNVRCSGPAILDVDVDTGGHTIALHSANYYKIAFTALNFTPKSELNPCADLEGTRARVEFVAGSGNTKSGGIVSIEMLQ